MKNRENLKPYFLNVKYYTLHIKCIPIRDEPVSVQRRLCIHKMIRLW